MPLTRRGLLLAGTAAALVPFGTLAQPLDPGSAAGPGTGRVTPRRPGPVAMGRGPSLDLNLTSGPLDGRITFTRASIGTYFDVAGVLQTATSNTPRFDFDPVTHAPRGLLIETSRTNNLLNSAGATGWTSGANSVVVANATTAPDGTTTATRVREDATASAEHYSQAAVMASLAPNQALTFSCYVRDQSRRYCGLAMFDFVTPANFATALYDLTLGTVTSSVAGGAATGLASSITPAGNGWYRLTVTATLSAAATSGVFCRVRLCNASGAGGTSYSGDNASAIYAWGAQVEIGSFATSLIPTTTVAVTRAAEVATMPVTGWLNTTMGTLAVEAFTSAQGVALQNLAMIDNGGSPNQWIALSNTVDVWTAFIYASGLLLNATTGSVAAGTHRMAASWIAGAQAACLDNGAVQTATAGGLPSSLTTLRIGTDPSGASAANGGIRRLRYWPRVLSSGDLQAATT